VGFGEQSSLREYTIIINKLKAKLIYYDKD